MIVIFNGPPGSGKDEAAGYFCARGFRHLSFKEVLFEETIKHFKVTRSWFMDGYDDRSQKEEPKAALQGMSRREAMIHVSESIIKTNHGAAYFGEQVAEQIDAGIDYAISDGGFVEELHPLIEKVGLAGIIIVQITREGCCYSSDSRRYFKGDLRHEYVAGKRSEINPMHFLDKKFDIVTFRIHNNGTLEQFHEKLNDVSSIIGKKQ